MKNLSNADSRIVKARQTGLAVCDLNEDEFDVALTGIIFNISVICGCQLPTHDAHVNALEKEFTIFLKEFGYEGMTPEEIITAFRMNANFQFDDKVETFGTIFNIDFASKVLKQYRNKRAVLDYKLGNMYMDKVTNEKLAAASMERRKKVIEQFDKYLKDEELELSNCYMQLAEDGAFFDKSAINNFMKEASDSIDRSDEKELGRRLRQLHGIDFEATMRAEKLAVKYLFESMKMTNRLKMYDENFKLIHIGFKMPEREPIKDEATDLPF